MPIDAVCVYYNYVGVARFAHAHQKSSRHVAWPACFEFGRGYSYLKVTRYIFLRIEIKLRFARTKICDSHVCTRGIGTGSIVG